MEENLSLDVETLSISQLQAVDVLRSEALGRWHDALHIRWDLLRKTSNEHALANHNIANKNTSVAGIYKLYPVPINFTHTPSYTYRIPNS
jgi:hypothetical protein